MFAWMAARVTNYHCVVAAEVCEMNGLSQSAQHMFSFGRPSGRIETHLVGW